MKYSPKYMAAAQRRRGKALDKQAFRAYQGLLRTAYEAAPCAAPAFFPPDQEQKYVSFDMFSSPWVKVPPAIPRGALGGA